MRKRRIVTIVTKRPCFLAATRLRPVRKAYRAAIVTAPAAIVTTGFLHCHRSRDSVLPGLRALRLWAAERHHAPSGHESFPDLPAIHEPLSGALKVEVPA
jgi:hypothetical protein